MRIIIYNTIRRESLKSQLLYQKKKIPRAAASLCSRYIFFIDNHHKITQWSPASTTRLSRGVCIKIYIYSLIREHDWEFIFVWFGARDGKIFIRCWKQANSEMNSNLDCLTSVTSEAGGPPPTTCIVLRNKHLGVHFIVAGVPLREQKDFFVTGRSNSWLKSNSLLSRYPPSPRAHLSNELMIVITIRVRNIHLCD